MKVTITRLMMMVLGMVLLLLGNNALADDSKRKGKSWHIVLTAIDADSGLKSVSNRIGQIRGATDGIDSEDLKEFGSNPKLAISSIIYEGKYKSNYHGTNRTDEWDLIVTSRDPNRTVTLKWSNMYKIKKISKKGEPKRYKTKEINKPWKLKKMRLIDLDTGEEIPAVGADHELQSYTFNMNGNTERYFIWNLERRRIKWRRVTR